MTREEQIDWLCRLRADLNNGVIFTPWNKEFTKALTGILEQEPCEDAISRQAVIDAFYNMHANGKEGVIYDHEHLHGIEADFSDTIWDAVEELEELPSVTPKQTKTCYQMCDKWQRTGHWKCFIHNAYHGVDEDGEPIWREVKVYHCDKCNRRTVIKENYCPNCGVKMVEPQESLESISPLNDKKKLSWLGKNCKDCGNEKCKKLGTLPKKYSCALWQAESEEQT